MKRAADDYIAQLGMTAHTEGGYFKELYKNNYSISVKELAPGCERERSLSSTIYYLLKSGQVSRFHRLLSDEVWFYHAGSPLRIYMIDSQGVLTTVKLGLAINEGESPQIVVPANTIFGADVVDDDSFSLVSCMVSPGFDYRDFLLYTREELIKQYPEHSIIITKLS